MSALFRALRGQDKLLQAYKDVFREDDPAVKLVLADLVDATGFAQPSYQQGLDPAAVAYREGLKAVINHILVRVECDFDYVGRINILLDAQERQIARLNNYQE